LATATLHYERTSFGRILREKRVTLKEVCQRQNSTELEEASTHKNAMTHAGNVFVTRDLDLLTPK